jgi:co-chaperonin GroES (HSP10)
LEPFVEEDEELDSEAIEVVKLKEDIVLKGVVSVSSKELNDLGVSKGDVVGFKENMDYRIKIDEKEYYRVATSRLLYKI